MVQNSAFFCLFQIGKLVDAMDKPKINVVRLQCLQLPVHGPFDLLQIQGPSVFSGGIIRTEMDLVVYLVPAAGSCLSEGRKWVGVSGGHIEIVDAMFQSHGHRLHRFLVSRGTQGTVPQSQDADLFCSLRQFAIFHTAILPSDQFLPFLSAVRSCVSVRPPAMARRCLTLQAPGLYAISLTCFGLLALRAVSFSRLRRPVSSQSLPWPRRS